MTSITSRAVATEMSHLTAVMGMGMDSVYQSDVLRAECLDVGERRFHVPRCGRAEMMSETKRDVEVIGNERG